MMMKVINRVNIALALIFLSVVVSPVGASVPPPPVNQKLGIPDVTFDTLTEPVCRSCHGRTDPDDTGRLVKPIYLPNRHHVKVNTPMKEGSEAPFPEFSESGNYTCFVCHATQPEAGQDVGFLVRNYRNCLNCHTGGSENNETATVHHLTSHALERDCQYCHGSVINNPFDGHLVSMGTSTCRDTYDPICYSSSPLTPRRSQGPGPDGKGACTFCHNSGVNDDPQNDPLAFDGKVISSNMETHHRTGIIFDPRTRNPEFDSQLEDPNDPCTLCHSFNRPFDQQFRFNCQNCHGKTSLHRIESGDSNGDGKITINTELPYHGHFGNPENCLGCHDLGVTWSVSASATDFIAVPYIEDIVDGVFPSGVESSATIVGTAFQSVDSLGVDVPVYVQIERGGDILHILPAESVTDTEVTVILTPDLPPGNFNLRVKAGDTESVLSNPMPIIITPAVTINSVTINNGFLSIGGNGFGGYLAAVDSGTSVDLKVMQTFGAGRYATTTENDVACVINSWTDSEISANCGTANCGVVTVNSVFGSSSAVVADCTAAPKRKKARRFFLE